MDFGLSQEISKDILKKSNVFSEISDELKKYFSEKDYGESIATIVVGIICVSPEFEFFFKPRKKYSKSKKLLEYDIVLDHKSVKDSNNKQIKELLFNELEKSFKNINVPGFQSSVFNNDFRKFISG
jgi:hypothetical protein